MDLGKFTRAVQIVGQAINDKSPKLLFQSVRIESRPTGTTFSGIGYACFVCRHDPSLVPTKGVIDICVPYAVLYRVVDAMRGSDLHIEQKGTSLFLRCGPIDTKISGITDDDALLAAKKISEDENRIFFDKPDEFIWPISRVSYSASSPKSGSAAILQGVRLEVTTGRLSAQASCSYQYASAVTELPHHEDQMVPDFGAVISTDSIKLLRSVVGEMKHCSVALINGTKIAVQTEFGDGDNEQSWYYVEVGTIGSHTAHPGIQKALDFVSEMSNRFVLDRKELLAALDMVIALRADRAVFTCDQSGVTVSTPTLEVGESNIVVFAHTLPSDTAVFAVDPGNFRDVVNGIAGETVTIASEGMSTPIHVKGSNEGFDAIIAPKTVSAPGSTVAQAETA